VSKDLSAKYLFVEGNFFKKWNTYVQYYRDLVNVFYVKTLCNSICRMMVQGWIK